MASQGAAASWLAAGRPATSKKQQPSQWFSHGFCTHSSTMKSIQGHWMLFLIIVLCTTTFTSSLLISRSDQWKESQSVQRLRSNHDNSLILGARNKTWAESRHLSPLIHHSYLQIQAAVQTSYTISVGNTHDGVANSNACSTTALLSTCNLRSAWALCLSKVRAVTCPSSASQAVSVTCAIILPTSSSIAFKSGNGGAMTLSALSSWASTCKNTLGNTELLQPS